MTDKKKPKFPQAAGKPGAAAPLPATIHVPRFRQLDHFELGTLLNVLRDRTAAHLYLLLTAGCDFDTGEVLTTYARLIELMTPPAMERARRRAGPTYKQLRDAMDLLEYYKLIVRNRANNAAQGQLRLRVSATDLTKPRTYGVKKKPTPDAK